MKNLYYIILFFSFGSFAQSLINNHWQLGETDLNFTNNTPVANVVSGDYGLSTVSDNNGSLLFYTDGNKVWNKNHLVMTNGSNISYGDQVLEVVIVQNPANTNQYFVIKAERANCLCSYVAPSFYTYSIVEFNSANPLGIVVNMNSSPNPLYENAYSVALRDTGSNVVVNEFYFVPLTSTKNTSDNSIWVIAQSENKMLSYKIDSLGFNLTPIESVFLDSQIYPTGEDAGDGTAVRGIDRLKFRISPDNSKLIGLLSSTATSNNNLDTDNNFLNFKNYFYKLDFNPVTGIFTNYQLLQHAQRVYNFEISNNSNNLYYTRFSVPNSSYTHVDGEVMVKDITNITSTPRQLYEFQNTTSATSKFNYLQRDRNGNLLISSVYSDLNKNKYLHKIENQDSFALSSVNVNYLYLNNKTINSLPQLIVELTNEASCESLTLSSEANQGSFLYQNKSDITTNGNYVINLAAQDITMSAQDFILLKPNTEIKAGSKFLAKIQPCTDGFQRSFVDNNKVDFQKDAERTLKLYPNPNNGDFTVELKNTNSDKISIEVFDLFGKSVFKGNTTEESFRLNLPNLSSGLYLVKVSSNTYNETLKFIKE